MNSATATAPTHAPRPPATAPKLGYVPAMDGLRGSMLLIVVAVHCGFIIRSDGSILAGGFIAMDVFFVQSGFLITALLLSEKGRTGAISFKNFYLRRACRLLPAVVVMLSVHAAYSLYRGDPPGVVARGMGGVLFYVANIIQAFPGFLTVTMPADLNHMWSLSMEEQFYITWPIALVLILRFYDRTKHSVPPVLWVAIIAAAITRALVYETQGWPAAYVLLWAHSDGIFMGCALAFLWRDGRLPKKGIVPLAWLSLAAMYAFMVLMKPLVEWPYYGGFTIQGILASILVIAVMNTDWSLNRFYSLKPVAWLGKTSYATYLWHVPIIEAVYHEMDGQPTALILGVSLTLLACATALSWRFVEKPFLNLKSKRYGSQAHGPEPAVAPTPPIAEAGLAVEGATT